MTRTEQDLRAVLSASEDEAPGAGAVLDGVRLRIAHRRRSRTVGIVLATVVAVGAVAAAPRALLVYRNASRIGVPTGSASATASRTHSPSAGTSPANVSPSATAARTKTHPLLTFTVRAGELGELHIEPFVVAAGVQLITVRKPSPGKTYYADILVYEPGWFDPAPFEGGEAVQVNGHPGYYKVVVDPTSVSSGHPVDRPALAWQYRAGAWAMIMGDNRSREDLLQVANTVVIGAPVAARVPFRVGYLPAGLHPIRLSQDTYEDQLWASVTFDRAGADLSDIESDPSRSRPLVIGAMPVVPTMAWTTTATVAGHPMMRIADTQVVVDLGGWWIEIKSGDLAPRISDQELQRVIAGLMFATYRDPGTWFEATTAVPGGND